MYKLSSKSLSLSAYLIMHENISGNVKYIGFNKNSGEFEFESTEDLHTWENKYDLSTEKQHDSIIMRIRKLKSF